ncbi:MAG: hypothetical protein KBT70_05430, partial [Roseovarius sp.]|uniref:AIR synthase-related protein n=1 Tax=Roseovarius sp. TaxID=1486281 RepID=UPI001B79C5BF
VEGGSGARVALLHDPQTAGGMLAAVDGGEAEELVARLRAAGHAAAVIGRVVAGPVGIRVRG